MWVGIRELGRVAALRWPGLAAVGGVSGGLWLLGFRVRLHAAEREREHRIEQELAAYASLDMRLRGDEDGLEVAKLVSRSIAEHSAFPRAATMVRDAEGRLKVAASVGMDDWTVRSLNKWGEGVTAAERDGGIRRGDGGLGARVGGKSFAVVLGRGSAETGSRRAIVTPLWTTGGRLLGVMVVGADGLMSARRSVLARALAPLEALAFKLERAMENVALAERLLRAERRAGLGALAGGMVDALNNPLTAVLGFAEIIADTTGERRVREDAGVIVREAMRMRRTLETLLEFWRPAAQIVEPVDVTGMVRELVGTCAERLEARGIRLVVQAGEDAAVVPGNRDRLRQVVEHLVNNAAQALAKSGEAKSGTARSGEAKSGTAKAVEERVIRVSVSVSGSVGSFDGERVHLIVSDTGPGFPEPGKVFEANEAMGLGLSVCYGIVHEHDGEISAFNLHPHGAAVAVELPAMELAVKKSAHRAGARAGTRSKDRTKAYSARA